MEVKGTKRFKQMKKEVERQKIEAKTAMGLRPTSNDHKAAMEEFRAYTQKNSYRL